MVITQRTMNRHLIGVIKLVVVTAIVLCGPVKGSPTSSSAQERKTYIVYMGSVSAEKSNDNHLLAAHRHHNLLSSVLGDEDLAQQVRLTSYGKSFDGFAANLLPQEAERLQENENVVSVFLSGTKQLSTTWSWDYLDMPLSVQRNLDMESDVIIGMIDSGINVDASSFSDKGLGPPPAKWKGICQNGVNFTGCNNKVIGARAYDVGNQETTPLTPLDDTEGHGTHTASTVAGSAVDGASFRSLANGTARGGVPSARLAIYKVCGPKAACTDANLMSALDDAIHDGVDVISMSLGAPAMDYFKDPVAIGSFHAMERGIIVSAAAGNKGEMGQVENVAPWILTVAASRTGKQLRTPIVLGNRFATLGVTFNYLSTKKWYPITNVAKATNDSDNAASGECDTNNLDPKKVKGKIMYCKNGESAPLDNLREFGAVGLIGDAVSWYPDFPQTYPMPASLLDPTRAQIVDDYINSAKNPRAYILKTTGVNVTAPAVAVFSSRGPNQQSRTILKPDVMAPGVNILAAFPPYLPGEDNSYGHPFRFLSGTSMACPHATAAAAFVKSHRPHWSPAAVKSALMTTARVAKEQNPLAEYAYGSGEIDPVKALDPGLVYDMSFLDYVRFLCSEGYSNTSLSIMTDGGDVSCPSPSKYSDTHDFVNYPSMNLQVALDSTSPYAAVFERTVTNVGPAKSTYVATTTAPAGMEIRVAPARLEFEKVGEKKTFKVEVKGPALQQLGQEMDQVLSGSLVWAGSSGHRVRSPVVVSFAFVPL